jgi:pimeloyl-ACP methyl ester carboxylesterase
VRKSLPLLSSSERPAADHDSWLAGSILELLTVIGLLTDPTAHGGRAEDAFDLVLPSMPGYGFSDRPQGTGWGPERIASAWHELMGRLGYKHYVSQGGDWGSRTG